jgi:streptogramin lyase
MTWVAAIGLTVVLAGAAAAPLLFTSSTTHSPSGAPALTARTLLRLPAASALAQGDGAAYVTDDQRDLLLRFDPGSGRVEGSVHLAGRPTAMVLDGHHLWVADAVDNQVVEVEAPSLHIVRSVSVPAGPSGLAVLGTHVWVTSLVANEITSIDTRSGVTGVPVDLADGAVRVAAGFGALWISGSVDRLTYFVPPSAQGRVPKLEGVSVGSGPIGVATGAGSVWVTNAQGGSVSQVDPSSLRVVHTYQVGGDPLSVGVAGDRVYVGDGTAPTLRTVFPSPASTVLEIATTARSLLTVGGSVWVAGANPGRVLSVSVG